MSLAEELVRAQTFTGANGAALATLDGDKLIWVGAVGQNPPKTGDRWSLAGSFANLCLGRRTRPQRCDDVEGDGRVDAAFRGLRAKSLALAPVHDAGKVTGILAVFSDNSRAFNGMHTAVLQTEADNLAELVQLARRAAGIQREEEAPPPPQNEVRPAEPQSAAALAPAPAPSLPPDPKPAAPAPSAENSPERELEALESAFILVPPPVAAAPSASAAQAVSPVAPAAPAAAAPGASSAGSSVLPKLKLVRPPTGPRTPGPAERPTLPGFMPLSATAAALAKAKPVTPPPAELVVEKKARKPASASPQPATELKNPGAPWLMAAPASVPTPPPAPAPVVKPASAPASVAAPRPSAPVKAPPPAPAPAAVDTPLVKFVPLAKSPEVKTPPPGSLKPVSRSEDPQQPLPAAADPFAEFSPAFVRAQARAHATAVASRPTPASVEPAASKEPFSTGLRRLPLVVAVVAAVALGGVWLRTRSHAAKGRPAPAVTPAAAPVAGTAAAPPSPAPQSQVIATPVPLSEVAAAVPAGKSAGSEAEKTPEKSPADKTQPVVAAVTRPAATVAAPAGLEVKAPAPVAAPLTTAPQEPAPQTLLSLPGAASAKLPDLPKPEAATPAMRRASTSVPAQLLHSVAPIYPAMGKALHLEGIVRLTAKVNAQGRVSEVVWVSGNSFFRENAMSAVRQWRYQPASLDGQPVESTIEIVLKFTPQ